MATTSFPAPIQPGIILTTGFVPVATAPAATQYVVRSAVFTNVTGTAATIRVNVRSLDIIDTQTVPANSTYVSPELAGMVLNPGDAIGALASAGSTINCFISGYAVV